MTDLLGERLAALADATDDGDWTDVERRARRLRPRLAAALAATAAAVLVAAGALAATGGWSFGKSDHQLTASTQVRLNGKAYDVSISVSSGRWFCVGVHRPGSQPAGGCGVSFMPLPRIVAKLHPPVKVRTGPPFGGLSETVGRGQIWIGAAMPDVVRIEVVDGAGRVHRTATVPAPASLRSLNRFWALGLPASHAVTIRGYDRSGNLVKSVHITGVKGRLRLG